MRRKSKSVTAVIIGRFSPFHNGHKALIDKAIEQIQPDAVKILIGSRDRASDLLVPWPSRARWNMMYQYYPNAAFRHIRDYPYPYKNAKWIQQVRNVVDARGHEVYIVYNKALSDSPYVSFFSDWSPHGVFTDNGLNATMVREVYFNDTLDGAPVEGSRDILLKNMLPLTSYAFLNSWSKEPQYKVLRETYYKMLENRSLYGPGPHVTTDAVVTWKSKVLLVHRGRLPGKGLLALPGGYLEPHLTLAENMAKELLEETGLKLSPSEFKNPRVFDAPNRSSTCRNVTHAFKVKLSGKLPEVKAGDDASHVEWFDVKDLLHSECLFHDDHLHILENMLYAR